MTNERQAVRQSTITFASMITLATLTFLLWDSVYNVIRGRRAELGAIARETDFRRMSDELAQASDYLTRMARKFAVTGDPRNLQAYWNEVKVTRTRERVMDHFRKTGTPRDEIDLLMLAKSNSDALIVTETRSMRLTLESAGNLAPSLPREVTSFELSPEDRVLSSESKRQLAIHILFDDAYDRAKAAITDPIGQFREKMNARVEGEVAATQQEMRTALFTLFGSSGLVFAGIILVLIVFQTKIASPVLKYTRALQNRSDDDAEFALERAGTRELQILADTFNRQWREHQKRLKAERELLSTRDGLEKLIRERTDQLRASEERMRALYMGAPFYTATWQRRGDNLVLVDFNDAAFKLTGGKVADYLGLNASDYYGENPEILSSLEKCFAERESVGIESLYRLKATGEIHHMAFRFAFVPPDLVLVHMDDINERKRVEQELRKLSVAVQQSPASIVITDRDGLIEYVNPKFTQVTGYTAEEAIGKNPRILKAGKTPPEEYSRLWHEILSGREWRGEFYNRKKNGDFYWELAVVSPIKDDKGDITHFIAVKEDITRRKQMEETLREKESRLRLLAENASDVIWTMETSGRITYVSPSSERLFGYTSQEAVNLKIEDFLMPSSLQLALTRLREVDAMVKAGEPVRSGTLELEHIRRDGATIWTEATFSGMYDSSGEFKGIVGASRDITERKRAEQVRLDFVSFATHQLRTPLSGIKWMLELASNEAGSKEEVKSYIQDAQASAERLIRLVNDLLDASRLEQGRIRLKLQKLDLCELTLSIMDDLAPVVQSKDHDLAFSSSKCPAWVSGEQQLLQQVIINLTSNAIKYTPKGGTISVGISEYGGLVRWEVRDSGIGIPESARERLFEKFFRAENAVSVETEGTGLGLYLVRLIVERLGGRVDCNSEVGRGSTFFFTLPAAD